MAYDRRHTLITPRSCPGGSPRGYSKVSNLMRVSFRISFRCSPMRFAPLKLQ